jgi:hypothetical protein
MVGANQYKGEHEIQSRSIFFVVKGDLYEGKDGGSRYENEEVNSLFATRVVPRKLRPYR